MKQTFTDLILLKAGVTKEELQQLKSNDTIKLSCLFKNDLHEDTKASASITKNGNNYMYNCFSCGNHGSELTLFNKLVINDSHNEKFTKKDKHNIYNLIEIFNNLNKLSSEPNSDITATELSKILKVIFNEDISDSLSDLESTLNHINNLHLLNIEEVNNRHFSGDIVKINLTHNTDILYSNDTRLSIERYPKNNSDLKSKMPKAIKGINYNDMFIPFNDIWNDNTNINSLLDKYVFITEGEKDMLLLRLFNLRAFSFLNGANSFKLNNNNIKILSTIYKNKTFVLMGDNDDAGILFNNQITRALFKNNPNVEIINFTNIMVKDYSLENKEDVTDLFLKYFNSENEFTKYIKKSLSVATIEQDSSNKLLEWFQLFNKENETVLPDKEVIFDNLYKLKNNHYYSSIARVINTPTTKNNNNLGINKLLNFSVKSLIESNHMTSLKTRLLKYVSNLAFWINNVYTKGFPIYNTPDDFETCLMNISIIKENINDFLFFDLNNTEEKDIIEYIDVFKQTKQVIEETYLKLVEYINSFSLTLSKSEKIDFNDFMKESKNTYKLFKDKKIFVTYIHNTKDNNKKILPSFVFNESKETNIKLYEILKTLGTIKQVNNDIIIGYVPIKELIIGDNKNKDNFYGIEKEQIDLYDEISSFLFDNTLNKYLFNWEHEFFTAAEEAGLIESFSFNYKENYNTTISGSISSLFLMPYLEIIKNKVLNNKDLLPTLDEIIFPLLQSYFITLFNTNENLLKSLNILTYINNAKINDMEAGFLHPDWITGKLIKKPLFNFLNINEIKISQEQFTFLPIDFGSPKNNPFFALSNMNNKEYLELKEKDLPGKIDIKEKIVTYYILQEAFEKIKNAEQDDLIKYSFIYSKSLKGGDFVGYIIDANIVEKNDEFLKDIRPTLEEFRKLYKNVKTYKDIEKISYGIYENMLLFNGGKKYSYKLHETYDLTFNSIASYTSIGKDGNKQYNLKAALSTFIAGDSGEGKSSTYEALHNIYEAGSKTAASNITPDAIIGGTANETRKINQGEFTKNHNKLLAIEEVSNLTAESPQSTSKLFGKLNDGIKDGVIKLSRVDDVLDTHAMTRFLAMSNPSPKRTGFKSVNNGETIEIASYEKQNPNDSHLQLFHSIVPMKSFWNRMNIKFLVTKQVRDIGKELKDISVKTNFTKEDFKFKLMWIWNLTYKNVSMEEKVGDYARKIANAIFVKNYRATDANNKNITNEDISIGDIGSITDDLIRVGFAFAALMVDTEDFKNIYLKEKHINIAAGYLVSIFNLTNIKKTIDEWKQSKLLDDEHIHKLIFNDSMFKQDTLPFKQTDQNGQWQDILKFVNSITIFNKSLKNGLSYYTNNLKEDEYIIDIFDDLEFENDNVKINKHALLFYESIINDIHINESSNTISKQELEQRLETIVTITDIPGLIANQSNKTQKFVGLLLYNVWRESKIIYQHTRNSNTIIIDYEKIVLVYNAIKQEIEKQNKNKK